MTSILESLHRWQLEFALGEVTERITLNRGYEEFEQSLSNEVRRVSKWRFIQPFDYGLDQTPYGFWSPIELYVRSSCAPKSMLEFLRLGRVSHFRGRVVESGHGRELVGSYRLTGAIRTFVMILVYLPFVFVPYGLFERIYSFVWGHLLGSTDGFIVDTITYVAAALGSSVFWAVGYFLGRFHMVATKKDRAKVIEVLQHASG